MADQGPSKQDITTIFKRLRSIPTNKQCFDCSANNPTWASVTYGVFLCIDCSAVHRSLGVHVTFIRSTQLDTSWTWLQLRAMQVGGNAGATAYFRQHGCSTADAQQKYHSRAATLYREKVHGLAMKALKTYGTKLHVDSHNQDTSMQSPTQKEIDFFKEHAAESEETRLSNWENLEKSTQPVPVTNGNIPNKPEQNLDENHGPSVEAALSTSPTEALKMAEPRKSTIGVRKPGATKKAGLGAKKGLGGQKVKTNFSDIESEAMKKDKDREQLAQNLALQEAKTKEDEEKKIVSMRLAYKDLSVQEKKQNEQLKNMDPKKAVQAERLGMGFSGSRGVSHSVMSNMTVIEQERPKHESDRYHSRDRDRDFDDFEFISSGGFSSGPPKYSDSPFGVRNEDRWGNNDDRHSSSGWASSKSNWDNDRFTSKQTTIEDIPMHKPDDDRGRSRKNMEPAAGDEAQKKYGNAKAISSDQFFGNNDPDFEMKQTLSKFEGKNAISSAELFGNGQSQQQRQYHGSTAPDLQDIKDGVKQGVTKVAGKISSLTNGIISSIQDNYG